MKYLKNNWLVIKTIMATSTVFILLMASGAIWWLLKDYQEVSRKLEVCESNFEEFNKQISGGKIVLDIKK